MRMIVKMRRKIVDLELTQAEKSKSRNTGRRLKTKEMEKWMSVSSSMTTIMSKCG